MTTPTWRDRLLEARDFLAFWGPLPDDTYRDDKKKEWERDLRRDLGSRDDDTLDAFAGRWQARYDEIEATRGTITGRAGSLLLFVGVLTTGGVMALTPEERREAHVTGGLLVEHAQRPEPRRASKQATSSWL